MNGKGRIGAKAERGYPGPTREAKFRHNRCRGGVWAPKTENFTKILAYERPAGTYPLEAYPLGDFYEIFIIYI